MCSSIEDFYDGWAFPLSVSARLVWQFLTLIYERSINEDGQARPEVHLCSQHVAASQLRAMRIYVAVDGEEMVSDVHYILSLD